MSDKVALARQGRRFALTVAIGFGVLALVAWWRHKALVTWFFGAIATLLLMAGLLIPHQLSGLERAWMKVAHAISRVTTPIFMSIVYFVVLTPVGVLRRLSGGNPLVHRADNGSYWVRRPARDAEKARRQMERQF